MKGVKTVFNSDGEPTIYQIAGNNDMWDWYQVFREPDDVLCVMWGRYEWAPELPSWFEMT